MAGVCFSPGHNVAGFLSTTQTPLTTISKSYVNLGKKRISSFVRVLLLHLSRWFRQPHGTRTYVVSAVDRRESTGRRRLGTFHDFKSPLVGTQTFRFNLCSASVEIGLKQVTILEILVLLISICTDTSLSASDTFGIPSQLQ